MSSSKFEDDRNTLIFNGTFDSRGNFTVPLLPPKAFLGNQDPSMIEKAHRFVSASIELQLKNNTITANGFQYLTIFPKTPEEVDAAYLEILRIAKENPEENKAVIECLALELLDTPQKIKKATDCILEKKEKLSQPALLAEAMIQQIEEETQSELFLPPTFAEIQLNEQPIDLKEDKTSLKKLDKEQKTKAYKKKNAQEKKRQEKKQAATLQDPRLDSRPLSIQLKPKDKENVRKVLKSGGVNTRTFAQLYCAVLRKTLEKGEGKVEVKENKRGSHRMLHLKTDTVSSGVATRVIPHGRDPNQPRLRGQRRNLRNLLNLL
ncbi:MAG: hypothetical protein V4487_01305 [Chlamydiota bacterium]